MYSFQIVRQDEENYSWVGSVSFEVENVGLMKTETHVESVKDLLLEEGLALREELIKEKVLKDRIIFRWLPPAFPSSAKFQGVVHHVDWNGRLFVTAHPEATRQKEEIDTKLQVTHDAAVPSLDTSEWEEGEACVARFSLDYSW